MTGPTAKAWAVIAVTLCALSGVRSQLTLPSINIATKFLYYFPEIVTRVDWLRRAYLNDDSPDISTVLNGNKQVLDKIKSISDDISRMDTDIKTLTNNMFQMLHANNLIIQATPKIEELEKIVDEIIRRDRKLNDYLSDVNFKELLASKDCPLCSATNSTEPSQAKDETLAKAKKHTLLGFTTWATGPDYNSIGNLLGRMHTLIVPNKKWSGGVFDIIANLPEEQTCQFKESRQQLLYNLYRTVLMADYKGYIMLQFSYMILKLYDEGNFVVESEREAKNFDSRLRGKITAIRSALANADRGLYNCDPVQYVEDVNYIALTKLLQGYIENEINFNKGHTCWENCAYYVQTEYYGCYSNEFCNKQRSCRGKIVDCKYVDSDMNICKSSDPQRRYDWIEYENGEILGNKGKCLARNFHKVDSWWKYLFWHCSYCLCLCDEPGTDSDRYFNLRPVTSNIDENMVVTGVRFRKHNRIIHLQIQHGVLGPNGEIDPASIMWKPIDTYKLTDEDVENGIDYHTMTWTDRTLDIDEVVGPANHVVTGIRFRKIGSHLNLEVRATPINFTTGHLFSEVHSVWLSNDNTELSTHTPRRELILTNPDIPIRYRQHIIDSEHNQFVRFQASSFKHDAAQSTVPYLDSQAIISNGFPLSGLGLIHRGVSGSGGFIAPKLITFDVAPYINSVRNGERT